MSEPKGTYRIDYDVIGIETMPTEAMPTNAVRPYRPISGECLRFTVQGIPRPKQSFKVSGRGKGYTPALTLAWQNNVGSEAQLAMMGRSLLVGALACEIDFYLPDRRRRDIDNLSKGTLDGMRGVVFMDDCQIVDLHLRKFFGSPEYGATVTIKVTA